MRIESIDIQNFRAFQEPFHMALGKYITAISGLNGIGKSTILAILSNSSELKPDEGSLYNGDHFRGDFRDIIMYDPKKDTQGQNKATIKFDDLPSNILIDTIHFRATVQKASKNKTTYTKKPNSEDYQKKITKTPYKRYRLIPSKEENGWPSNAKMHWPSYYLGLSRIYPVGENDTATTKALPDEISSKVISIHSDIMQENLDPTTSSLENINIGGIPKKKSGIQTSNYSATSNSSGQDNLGQILLAVLSFEKLKNENPEKYIGGILTIDELDATLHPAAQNKLIDWLFTMSKELSLQIVFTTHSITLLEYIFEKSHAPSVEPGDIEIDYLRKISDQPGKIESRINASPELIRNDLKDTYTPGINFSEKVMVLTEDAISRIFLNKIINFSSKPELGQMNLLDIDMSWSHLIKLISSEPTAFKDYICILDPDLNSDLSNLHDLLVRIGSNINVNSSKGNIFILPGDQSIEKMLWTYVSTLPSNSDFFEHPYIFNSNWTHKHIIEDGPDSYVKSDTAKERRNEEKMKYKHWYNDNSAFMPIVMEYWINDHKDEVNNFIGRLYQSFRRIESNLKK